MLLRDENEARAYVAERCAPASLDALDELAVRLRHANSTQNLIAKSTTDSIWLRHFADSAQLLDHVDDVPRETAIWLDLGSGAGFPGLVIAIMRPQTSVVLVESRNLRIQWLREVSEALGLQKCRVDGNDVGRIATIEASVISARAFAPLPRLVELSARFSTKATYWVLPKGRSAAQDIATLPDALQTRFHVKQSVTDSEAGIIVGCGKMERPSAC